MKDLQGRSGRSRRDILKSAVLASAALAVPAGACATMVDGDALAHVAARFLAGFDHPGEIAMSGDRARLSAAADTGCIGYFDGDARLLILSKSASGLLPLPRHDLAVLGAVLAALGVGHADHRVLLRVSSAAGRRVNGVRSIALGDGVDAHVILLAAEQRSARRRPAATVLWKTDAREAVA